MMAIVPVTFGKTDVWGVFVLIREMSPGVMEREVLTMIITMRNMEKTLGKQEMRYRDYIKGCSLPMGLAV